MKIKVLESQIYPKEVMLSAVSKTISSRITEINRKIKDLCDLVEHYEKKYGLSTNEFYKKFKEGEMGDDIDFMEWEACKELLDELTQED
ncbi:MAG: hypothetical protein ACE5J3_04980 [Methanosarcinales archaeon]